MRPQRGVWLPLAAVSLIVMLQSVRLLPVLGARVGMILARQTPPPAPYHIVYVVLEFLKLTCLFVAGALCLKVLDSRSCAPISSPYTALDNL